MRNRLAGLFIALGTAMAVSVPASAVTVGAFDNLSSQDKGRVVESAVHKILDYYTDTQPDQAKATCLMNLFTPAADGVPSRGAEMVMKEVDKARKAGPDRFHVEAIVFGVIQRECSAP